MTTFDALFERPPLTWGLRGDPHVWWAMRERLRDRPLPEDFFTARGVLEQTFAEVTGAQLSGSVDRDDHVHRPELATGSGMSDGMVSLHFWQFTGVPILLDRWAAGTGAR